MTVFHSDHLPHLLKFSGQPYRRQKTLTADDFSDDSFQQSSFSDTDHTIRCTRRRSSSFIKTPERESQSREGHACFFSGGLNLTRRRVEHFPTTRFHLQPHLTPSSHSPSVLVPFEPCKCISWVFVSVGPLNSLFTTTSGDFLSTPSPARVLGSVLLPFQ